MTTMGPGTQSGSKTVQTTNEEDETYAHRSASQHLTDPREFLRIDTYISDPTFV